jgi:hypothetical protein
MSKMLNGEGRIDALRRESVKAKPEPSAPPRRAQAPVPPPYETTPAPLAVPEPPPAAAATAVLERAAEPPTAPSAPGSVSPPVGRGVPAISPDAVRYAHRWYSALTFFIAFGVTLAIITIVRSGLQRARVAASTPQLLPPPDPPAAIPVSAAPAVSVLSVAPEAPPRLQRGRDPFAEALSPEPEDAALAEATRVYTLMESALREASRTISAPQTAPSIPAETPDVPDHH